MEVIGDEEDHMEPLKIADVLFELRFNKYIDTNEGVTKLYSPRRARAEARIQAGSEADGRYFYHCALNLRGLPSAKTNLHRTQYEMRNGGDVSWICKRPYAFRRAWRIKLKPDLVGAGVFDEEEDDHEEEVLRWGSKFFASGVDRGRNCGWPVLASAY